MCLAFIKSDESADFQVEAGFCLVSGGMYWIALFNKKCYETKKIEIKIKVSKCAIINS